MVAEANGSADGVGVGGKFGGPEIVADDDGTRSRNLVLAGERAAVLRKNAKGLEEFGGDMRAENDARFALGRREFAAGAVGESGEELERLYARAPVEEIGMGRVGGGTGLRRGIGGWIGREFESMDGDKTVGIGEWQGGKKDGGKEAEDGSGGSDDA